MMETEIILQVALDFLEPARAYAVAGESAAGGADWLEAGTPLIKSEGLDCVRELRRRFPKNTIVADMKIMDTGRLEVEAAAKAGASVVTVLGVADDSTVREAVGAARAYGAKIMVDLMDVPDSVSRAKALAGLGVDYLCVHLSIDEQMSGREPISELRKLAKEVDLPLAVAGGLNSESAAEAALAGAKIIIVGGAITKAADAKKAASDIKKALKTGKAVRSESYKKYSDPMEAFLKVSSANIADAMHRTGSMEGIACVSGGKMVGRAVTVRTYPGDWSKPVEAIDVAKEGEVIVIDAGGTGRAVWGGLASASCVGRKLAGVVVDGAVRDVGDIRSLSFPAFSRFTNPAAGEPLGLGEINVPIRCGGVLVRPGDYVVGDADGVVVVPCENAVEVANRALDVFEKEARLFEEIKRGSTLSEVCEIKKWEKVK